MYFNFIYIDFFISSIRLVITKFFTPFNAVLGGYIKYSSADLISSLKEVDKFI